MLILRKKRCAYIALSIVVIIFLAVIIPIIINECYKKGAGYCTVWDGTVVLNYYGILLAQGVTVFGIATTISNERRRDREQTQKQLELKAWIEMENVIHKTLEELHPQKLVQFSYEALQERNLDILMVRLLSFQTNVNIFVDKMHCSIDADYDSELNTLVKNIDSIRDDVLVLQQKYLRWLSSSMELLKQEEFALGQGNDETGEKIMREFDLLTQAVDNLCKKKYNKAVEDKRELFSKKKKIISLSD